MSDTPLPKYYIRAQELLEAAFQMAVNIFEDGYRPALIAGFWRGGTPVAIAVQEYYEYRGVSTDHIALRITSYTGINRQSSTFSFYGLDYIVEHTGPDDPLLLVDDVFDSGRSMAAVLGELSRLTGRDCRERVRIACPWYKPGRNKTDLLPDYYIHANDDWLIFPHELVGLTDEEIINGKPPLGRIFGLQKP